MKLLYTWKVSLTNEASTNIINISIYLGLAGKELWEEALHDVVIEAVQACIDAYAVPNIYAWKVFKFIPTPENSEQILEDAKNKWIKVLNYIESIAEKRGKKYIIGDSVCGIPFHLF